ncbi:hypothetical protein OAR36_05145 [Pseudomonadales bacterium]|nr:hypothetical protein [Pseudomonadales bacterium]
MGESLYLRMALATVMPLTYQRSECACPTLEALSANFRSEDSELIGYADVLTDELAIAGIKETRASFQMSKGLSLAGGRAGSKSSPYQMLSLRVLLRPC